MKALTALKTEAIRLRVEERRSLKDIQERLGISKGSASLWLRDYPLGEKEIKQRQRIAAGTTNASNPKGKYNVQREESKYYRMAAGRNLTPHQMMKIAESAVLLRLVLHGFTPYQSLFDGDKVDWLVISGQAGTVLKIEVRCVNDSGHGQPVISLSCSNGRKRWRRLDPSEFDVVVGYDLFSDTAYVYTSEEVSYLKSYVSISKEAVERWDKL